MKKRAMYSMKTQAASDPEMKSEYDFSGGVRGKYYNQYIEGAKVIVLDPEMAAGGKKRRDDR